MTLSISSHATRVVVVVVVASVLTACGGASRSGGAAAQGGGGGTTASANGGGTTTSAGGAQATAGGSSALPSVSTLTPAIQPGKDAEHPVMRCGPRDSYYYVATEFRCGDGSNPFNGNLAYGQRSRLGNVGANSTGHIIDLYEVPCPEGPQRVFVDMYGCPSRQPQTPAQPETGGAPFPGST